MLCTPYDSSSIKWHSWTVHLNVLQLTVDRESELVQMRSKTPPPRRRFACCNPRRLEWETDLANACHVYGCVLVRNDLIDDRLRAAFDVEHEAAGTILGRGDLAGDQKRKEASIERYVHSGGADERGQRVRAAGTVVFHPPLMLRVTRNEAFSLLQMHEKHNGRRPPQQVSCWNRDSRTYTVCFGQCGSRQNRMETPAVTASQGEAGEAATNGSPSSHRPSSAPSRLRVSAGETSITTQQAEEGANGPREPAESSHVPLPPEELEEEEIPVPKVTSLQEIKEDILIERADPSEAALRSVKTWEELQIPEDLLKGIYAKGFVYPSRIQELALPLVLKSKHNLIAQAQNGSGKTATFALAMLAKTERYNPNPQSLCLCHTRELAKQNLDVITELGKFTGVTTWLAVPQCKPYDRSIGAQIVVGTPGKVREMLMKRVFFTKDIQLFVLDEADVLMDHMSNMAAQVNEIRKAFPQKTQVLLFSATYPERVRKFATAHVPNANRLEVKREELALSAVSQFYIPCEDDQTKFVVLSDLYGCMTVGQSVIFVNSRKLAFELAEQMKREGHAISLICGTQATGPERMDLETRERVMAEFRNGETKVLIATDVLARGIDVPQVTLVINYNLPLDRARYNTVDHETYIHRVGRTGRFGLKGLAISLVDSREREMIKDIQNYFACTISELVRDPEKIEEMVTTLRAS